MVYWNTRRQLWIVRRNDRPTLYLGALVLTRARFHAVPGCAFGELTEGPRGSDDSRRFAFEGRPVVSADYAWFTSTGKVFVAEAPR